MTDIEDRECITRILFLPTMIEEGEIQPNAFPMQELLKQNGKDGSSVDRFDKLPDPHQNLMEKATLIENPGAGRSSHGYANSSAKQIRSIVCSNGLNNNQPQQAFRIEPDPVVSPLPKAWHAAHALIFKFDDSYTKGFLRGSRDRLIEIFQAELVEF